MDTPYLTLPFFAALETLFVVAGYVGTYINSVEVISLSGENVTCPAAASFPYPVDSFGYPTLNGQPVVCGGDIDGSR